MSAMVLSAAALRGGAVIGALAVVVFLVTGDPWGIIYLYVTGETTLNTA